MTGDEFATLLDDLVAEQATLDAVVAGLDEAGWARPTAAAGWDVRDTVAHLAGAEALAEVALRAPDAFAARLSARPSSGGGGGDEARPPGGEVLARWRGARASVVGALRARAPRDRVPWVAGDMSAAAFATARLMETWAHGEDVADALDEPYPATDRLRHVADLGVRTRGFALAIHGRGASAAPVLVELVAPDGGTWTWGPAGAADAVRGPALDFARVVTQRRHVDDTTLAVTGPEARAWMEVAQCFAGPPTTARR